MRLVCLYENARDDYPSDQYLYHGGLKEDAESVLSKGLLMSPPKRTWPDSTPGAVFLCNSPRQASKWVRLALKYRKIDAWTVKIIVYEIDISKLDVKLFEPDTIGINGDWRYKGNIPPEAIKLMN